MSTAVSRSVMRNVKLVPALPADMRDWQALPRREYRHVPDHRLLPLDAAGRRRSRATHHSHRKGVSPNNKGKTYEPTPYTDYEVMLLLRVIREEWPDVPAWMRLHAWIGFAWRSGLRISETLDLVAADLDADQRAVLVRHGKGDKRRISAMDDWGWQHIQPWLELRREYPNPDGHVFCICEGPTKGLRWSPSGVRAMLAKVAVAAGFEKRLAPHQLRHTMAVGLLKDGVPLVHVSRQLGHSNIATTDTYLRGISPQETIDYVASRPAPASHNLEPSA